MIKYWNREGIVLLCVGLLVGLLTHAVATAVMGPDSLRAKGIAWIVCGSIWVLADTAAAIHQRKPIKQLEWLIRWSGGLTGFSVSFLGIVAIIAGISLLIGPDSL